MEAIFEKIDLDGNGVIDIYELRVGLEKLKFKNIDKEVKRIFTQMDMDGSGEIDLAEWFRSTIDKRTLLSRESLL